MAYETHGNDGCESFNSKRPWSTSEPVQSYSGKDESFQHAGLHQGERNRNRGARPQSLKSNVDVPKYAHNGSRTMKGAQNELQSCNDYDKSKADLCYRQDGGSPVRAAVTARGRRFAGHLPEKTPSGKSTLKMSAKNAVTSPAKEATTLLLVRY